MSFVQNFFKTHPVILVKIGSIGKLKFSYFASDYRREKKVVQFKTFTRSVRNVSKRESFLRIRNFRQLTRACFTTRDRLEGHSCGSDRVRFAKNRLSSLAAFHALILCKEILEIAGSLPQLPT